MEKIDTINQLHQRFKDMFQCESNDNQKCKSTSSIRDSLGELMHSQINLLKVYNNTPLEKFNQTVETWFPVMAAIYLLRQIIKLGDVLFASGLDSENEKNSVQQPPDQIQRSNLRRMFVQNDGLKYLFGVRVVDHLSEDPDQFKRSHISPYITE